MRNTSRYLTLTVLALLLLLPFSPLHAQADVDAATAAVKAAEAEIQAAKAARDDAWDAQDAARDAMMEAAGTDQFEDAVDEWEKRRKATKRAYEDLDRAWDKWHDAVNDRTDAVLNSSVASAGMGAAGHYAILILVIVAVGLSAAILIRQT